MSATINKISFAFLLSVCNYVAYAQYVYIDKFYDSGLTVNQSEGIWNNSLHELNDGYLFISFTMNNSTGIAGTWLIKTDFNGDTLWTKNYVDIVYSETPQNMIYTTDGNYVIASSFRIVSSSNPYDPSLTKISPAGDILWKKTYGSDTLYENINSVIQTNDGAYAIIASRGLPSQADAYLIKTDSEGNEQWEKQYGGNNYEAGKSLVQTPDNGFLLLGWTRSYGNGQRDFYLVKTDSLGNEQWYKTYGGGDEIGKSILRLSDGNYLLTGSGSQPISGSQGMLIKITPSGDVIWSENYIYNNNSGNNFHASVELINHDIITVGMTNAQSNAGYLVKTNSVGGIIWQRQYDKSNSVDLFYTLLPTSDNGFLLGGQAWNATTNNQDAWLLKVDSLGCPYPNCVTGIDEEEKKVLADVYPNPASEILNIELQENKHYNLTLTDLQGKVVFVSLLDYARSDKFAIDVSGFANGVYFLSLQNSEQRTTVKIVIQH